MASDSRTWTDVQPEPLSEADTATLSELGLPTSLDSHNATLLDNVHPRCHPDPDPTGVVYDLVALGAGAAGLVSSKQTARRGGKSALIEMHLHGGDCLNVGCVPSKALIRAARAAREAKHMESMGISVGDVKVDFPAIMERMRRLRAKISPADAVSAEVALGVDVFQGRGKFTGPNTIEVNGKTLTFKKAVVATGGSPRVPPIPGLANVPYMTNATLFNLTELPPRMIIVGAGPIGMEMAQCFTNFGSHVTVLDLAPKVLPREDQDAAKLVEASLLADGCNFALGVKDMGFSKGEEAGGFQVINVSFTNSAGEAESLACEGLLVATGRQPNVEGIGLEEAGVEYDKRFGVAVNDLLVTSNENIYAIGDCSSKYQFTHVAGNQAMMVVENAIFGGSRLMSEVVVPRCTYTTPEVASTGASEDDLKADGVEYEVFMANLEHNDRAILESSNTGFCKLLVRKDTPEILGGTIVAENAGDIISEISLAIKGKVGLDVIGQTFHPYPTVAECIAGCAHQYKVRNWKTM